MKWGVPATVVVEVALAGASSPVNKVAMPKSRSLGMSRSYSRATKMLAGLTSRWTIPAAWVSDSPRARWAIVSTVAASERRPWRWRISSRVSPSSHSITM